MGKIFFTPLMTTLSANGRYKWYHPFLTWLTPADYVSLCSSFDSLSFPFIFSFLASLQAVCPKFLPPSPHNTHAPIVDSEEFDCYTYTDLEVLKIGGAQSIISSCWMKSVVSPCGRWDHTDGNVMLIRCVKKMWDTYVYTQWNITQQ